jgi:hypothetical protein
MFLMLSATSFLCIRIISRLVRRWELFWPTATRLNIRVWLDDVRPAPPGWEWVKTAPDCIDLLNENQVTHLSLDHDLLPEHYTDASRDGTGLDVLTFLESRPKDLPTIYLHTQSRHGRPRMEDALVNLRRLRDGT